MSTSAGAHTVIAIDGPAASGKSSVAGGVARRLGYFHVNTGAMYRAATWFALERGIPPDSCDELAAALGVADVAVTVAQGRAHFFIESIDAADVAYLPEVARNVSTVARCGAVRKILVRIQRQYVLLGDVVVEGRDIGSVVFPETPWKYFIDASPEVRQQRRQAEGLRDSILERDRLDSTRAVSPLKIAEGALRIDSTQMTIDQVIDAVCADLAERGLKVPRPPEVR